MRSCKVFLLPGTLPPRKSRRRQFRSSLRARTSSAARPRARARQPRLCCPSCRGSMRPAPSAAAHIIHGRSFSRPRANYASRSRIPYAPTENFPALVRFPFTAALISNGNSAGFAREPTSLSQRPAGCLTIANAAASISPGSKSWSSTKRTECMTWDLFRRFAPLSPRCRGRDRPCSFRRPCPGTSGALWRKSSKTPNTSKSATLVRLLKRWTSCSIRFRSRQNSTSLSISLQTRLSGRCSCSPAQSTERTK